MVLPNYEMGRVAVETLLALEEEAPGARARRRIVKIDCPLVERETVAGAAVQAAAPAASPDAVP